MDAGIHNFTFLLLLAGVVSILARRLRLPYTVGLVVAGTLLAWLLGARGAALTKDLVFLVLLPPLVFEAAFHLHWPELKRYWLPVAVLATVGVGICAVVVAGVAVLIGGWAWAPALLFGILVSPTDPVAVIATFKELGLRGRLQILVEAESLFNDGTAAALFTIAVVAVTSTPPGPWSAAGQLLLTVAGGIGCGIAVGAVMLLLGSQSEDTLVHTTCTTVAAYGSFLMAESVHVSGVLAALSAGILMGNSRFLAGLSPGGRAALEAFWDYAAFIANAVVFLLMGMRLANQGFGEHVAVAAAAIAAALLGRAATVYGCCAFFRRPDTAVPLAEQHILFWGGLRGALGVALALGLPETTPHRSAIEFLVFAIAGFSILVQGLTITPLLRRLGLVGRDHAAAAHP